MKTLLSSVFVLLMLTLTSSTPKNKVGAFEKFGTYMGAGTAATSPLQLQLNADHTYSYKDLTNTRKQIQITGNWEQDGHRIYLKGHEEIKFHSNWKIDPNCLCLKSNKGMTFYRLCQ